MDDVSGLNTESDKRARKVQKKKKPFNEIKPLRNQADCRMNQGCQIFLDTIYQNGGNTTDVHKI
jgi:hypothetical protein